jgi:cyclomaltodextrinase / maltogenic alpha-amylase / neopullulanase
VASEHPRWIDSAVLYAAVPDLWGDDGPAAVERQLGDLQELGVDALWLWPPVSERAPGQQYAIMDYFRLDPSWGPPAAFASLVAAAHRHGLRVLLDVVPNHLSDQSPWFQDAQRHGPASRYWGFFDRDAAGRPTHYFDWDHLPNLNYDNPEVRRMVVEAFTYWVRELGADGFRVDVAWGVRQRRPDFWPGLRRELERIRPDLLLLAEAITNHPEGYAPDAVVLRFLNNNDTGTRFVDRHGPGLTRVAATLQLTVPGMSALFAGDEVGASYQPYSTLTPIPWRDRHGLRPHYRRLIGLRRRLPALSGRRVELLETASASALAYLRPAPPGAEPVLVVCNFGGPADLELGRTPELDAVVGDAGALADRLGGRPVPLRVGPRTVTIPMGAESAHVLTPGAD